MFQCPTKMGKGVLVSPTVHGNTLLGPSAEDIPDDTDVSTTAEGLKFVLDKARLTWPNLSVRGSITNFSGIRAHEEKGDFVIGAVSGAKNAYETVGIESPGLSCCARHCRNAGQADRGGNGPHPQDRLPAGATAAQALLCHDYS